MNTLNYQQRTYKRPTLHIEIIDLPGIPDEQPEHVSTEGCEVTELFAEIVFYGTLTSTAKEAGHVHIAR